MIMQIGYDMYMIVECSKSIEIAYTSILHHSKLILVQFKLWSYHTVQLGPLWEWLILSDCMHSAVICLQSLGIRKAIMHSGSIRNN